MDPWRATAEVVVIEKGRIAAVGERALVAADPGARPEDLTGRALLPGFIDAHNHLSIAALHPLWADLSRTCAGEELARALAGQAAGEPEARWVRGAGWDEAAGGLVPDRHALDALGLDRPVIVVHYSLHQCVVSSQALDELGIGRTTPDPPGGTIERGPDGEPTGLLVERAWSEAHARSLAAYRDPARWGGLIAALARALVADGITCVHDAACPPSAESVYRTLAGAGALPISVLMMPHGEALLTPPSAARSSLPHRARYPRLARTACGDGRPRGDRRRPARIPPPHGPAGGRLSARAGDLVALRRDGPRRPSARRLVRRSVRVPRAAAHLDVWGHAPDRIGRRPRRRAGTRLRGVAARVHGRRSLRRWPGGGAREHHGRQGAPTWSWSRGTWMPSIRRASSRRGWPASACTRRPRSVTRDGGAGRRGRR